MQPKVTRVYLPKIRTIVVLALFVSLVLLFAKGIAWSMRLMRETGLTPITVARLALDTGTPLKSTNGRTNLLILGIGGGTHPGADLTDTMLLISLDVAGRSMAMVSIPRDIWSDTLQDKINSAYHYGEEKSREAGSRSAGKVGGGLVLSKAIVEEVMGMPIHYSLVIDFSGFRDMIDIVDGVDVTVPSAFTDPEFPVEGKEDDDCEGDPKFRCRYQALHFDAGIQRMDGERALMYARSRHAEGEEGSDFARSRRQQDVLVALKGKLSNPASWFPPTRMVQLLSVLDRATDTDLNIGEFLTIGKAMARTPESSTKKIALEDQLTSPPTWLYGRYVLVPAESFESIHEYIKENLQ